MSSQANTESGLIARDLHLSPLQVERTLGLLDEGNTVPFITRYRKDQTQGLDEEQIRAIKQAAERYRAIAERKATILKSIQAQGKLTEDLKAQIEHARSIKRLEDLYLPFKPKKQTLATLAKQRGLEPLAQEVLAGEHTHEALAERARQYIRVDRELPTIEDVYQGVGHLIAEIYSEDVELRSDLRRGLWRFGKLKSAAITRDASRGRRSGDDEPEIAAAANSGSSTTTSEPPVETVANPDEARVTSEPDNKPTDAETTDPAPEASDATTAAVPPTEAKTETKSETKSETKLAAESKPGTDERKSRRKKKKKTDEAFADYYDFEESLNHLPPHRILAINRGEKAKVLRVKCVFDDTAVFEKTQERLIPAAHPQRDLLLDYLRDAVARLLLPSLEREVRRELTEKAETHAVEVFAQNLRHLLLQRPVNGRRVLAVDPGYKSGCKIAILDEMGSLVESQVIYVVGNEQRRKSGREWLVDAIRRHEVTAIAIGNGTASRAAEELVASVLADELKDLDVAYVIVNEAGASVYSTSTAGREELPDLDPTIRSAVSIGRRLLDPLSELVKISPEHLGVGMYQHDVKARHLRESLDEVVASCVNYVGVDANTASPALLKYVSGLNQLSARRFVEHRKENGPFRSREQFRDVAGFGDATFVQAAGFLKIGDPENVLDGTWIHPESYELAERVLGSLDCSLQELAKFLRPTSHADTEANPPVSDPPGTDIAASESKAEATTHETAASEPVTSDASGTIPQPPEVATREHGQAANVSGVSTALEQRIKAADVNGLASELDTGELLIRDILSMLMRPGRDPRDSLPPPVFRTGATKIEDLEPGMALDGRVLNVVDFGVFVDIGLSESGLVHISRLSREFVKDPHQAFAVGQPIKVWVVDVDKQRRRVSLTAIDPALPVEKPAQRRGPKPANKRRQDQGPRPARGKRPVKKTVPRRKPAKPKPPPKPLEPEVAEGKAPMRSFTELMQFYEHKKHDH